MKNDLFLIKESHELALIFKNIKLFLCICSRWEKVMTSRYHQIPAILSKNDLRLTVIISIKILLDFIALRSHN